MSKTGLTGLLILNDTKGIRKATGSEKQKQRYKKGKGGNMNKTASLEKIIDIIGGSYSDLFKKLDDWKTKRTDEFEKFKTTSMKLTQEAASEKHNELVKQYEEEFKAIMEKFNEKIAEYEKSYIEEVHDFYYPNGERIIAADQAIINSGILTSKEAAEMAIRYAKEDNTTMLRILNDFITGKKIKIEDADATIALKKATLSGEKELKVLKSVKGLMNNIISLASGNYSSNLFRNSAVNTEQYIEDAKIKLLESKLYLTEEEIERIEEHEKKNKNYQDLTLGE